MPRFEPLHFIGKTPFIIIIIAVIFLQYIFENILK
jgi:hypothetical protein